jgi:chitin synthase
MSTAITIPSPNIQDDEVEKSLSGTRWVWLIFSYLLTFWLPDTCLLCCYPSEARRQAFREKLAVFILFLLGTVLFIGVYVVVPSMFCHQPPLPFFNHTIPYPHPTFCHWYRVGQYVPFAIVGFIMVLKVVMALWLLIPWTRNPCRDKYVMICITAYTEGRQAIEKTIVSTIRLYYPHQQKLLVIVCDGLLVGKGNGRPTPEIVLQILGRSIDECPDYLDYDSLKGRNRAKLYSGIWREVPYLVIVKCGVEGERKSGNRGKRDSQLIVMNYLSNLFYHLPLSPLEQAMSAALHQLGLDPNTYELLLSLDSDTVISKRALHRMVPHFEDPRVVAVTGETRVDNPGHVVSAFQVYEYYISHHLSKAFESMLGRVQCLPGCMALYRIKTLPKRQRRDRFQAIRGKVDPFETLHQLSSTEPPATEVEEEGKPYLIYEPILKTYANRNLDSLHVKNLLSLGEDRFLTCLLMRFHPKGKLKFVPKAKCYTTVPDNLCVLLSQRRRWNNSTIHCMLEAMKTSIPLLLKVNIVLELISTFLLPVSILYLAYLIFVTLYYHLGVPWLIIYSFGAILASQFLLIVVKLDFQYLLWFIPYLISLPFWYIVIPIYSLWKMDDVTWGTTRQVESTQQVAK